MKFGRSAERSQSKIDQLWQATTKMWQSLKSWPNWLVLGLTFLALFLRLWDNTVSPPSPYWEEAALGYDAYSILKTGHDHLGNAWPIVAFPSFGDYKPALYFYTTAVSIAVFGLNAFAVRLPAVIFSALTIPAAYLLAKKLSGSKKIAFWSGFLLAIQPWSWQVGRVGFEVNLATALLVWATLFTVYFLQNHGHHKTKTISPQLGWAVLAALCFSLAMYAYHASRLLAPLYLLAVLVWYWPWQDKLEQQVRKLAGYWPAILLGILLITPLFFSLTDPAVTKRFSETSIWADSSPVLQTNHYRELLGNTWWSRVVFHRYWWRTWQLSNNWAVHLSPSFLFFNGDANLRHHSGFFGALYPIELLTVIAGVGALIKTKKKEAAQLLFSLILITPVPAMLTLATPHALRTLPLATWLAIVSAWGLVDILDYLGQALFKFNQLIAQTKFQTKLFFSSLAYRLLIIAALVFFLILWVILWIFMRFEYPALYASQWQYGYQQLYDYLADLDHQAKSKQQTLNFYITRDQGRPAMYYFFTQQIDPQRVQTAAKTASKDQLELLEFENWHFQDLVGSEPGVYAVTSTATVPNQANRLHEVTDPNGKVIWQIYQIGQN